MYLKDFSLLQGIHIDSVAQPANSPLVAGGTKELEDAFFLGSVFMS
jgi:hypothetical protein